MFASFDNYVTLCVQEISALNGMLAQSLKEVSVESMLTASQLSHSALPAVSSLSSATGSHHQSH